MHFTCESCRATLHIADEKVKGKRLVVRCKRCGNKITIADPALGAAAAQRAAAKPAASPGPEPELKPVNPDGDRGDSDTESTRAMETSVLEEALRASKLAGEDAAALAARASPPPSGSLPLRDPAVWFAMVGGKQIGPMGRAELGLKTAQGAIGPRTYLWREGMGAWQRAKDVEELASLFAPSPEQRLPTPAASAPVAARAREAADPSLPAEPAHELGGMSAAEDGGSAQSRETANHAPLGAAQSPAPAAAQAEKPAAKAAGLDISLEGYQRLGAEVSGESTNVEALPLGERVHQDAVAKELFTSGEQSGASALDLANWASEELVHKEQQRNSSTLQGQGPLRMSEPGGQPGERPLFGSADSAAGPSPLSPAASTGLGIERIQPAEASGAAQGRTLKLVALIGGIVLVVLILWYVLAAGEPAPSTVKVEVAAPHRPAVADGAAPKSPAADDKPAPDAPKTDAAPPAAVAAAPAADKSAAAAAADAKPSTATAAAPARAQSGLRPEEFGKAVSATKPSYKKCIDEALRRTPKMRVGKVQIAMKIAPAGNVLEASIDKKDVQESALGQCLIQTTQHITFPRFGGEAADAVIPLQVTAE